MGWYFLAFDLAMTSIFGFIAMRAEDATTSLFCTILAAGFVLLTFRTVHLIISNHRRASRQPTS